MYARVVDFGWIFKSQKDERRVQHVINKLWRLGFNTSFDDSLVQPCSTAYGAVAAMAAARLSESDWQSVDLTLSVRPSIIYSAVRSWLCLHLHDEVICPALSKSRVWWLYAFFLCVRRACTNYAGAVFGIRPIDEFLAELHAHTSAGVPVNRIYVCNTDCSKDRGSHWFVVRYCIC
jgi:hypothetical protein